MYDQGIVMVSQVNIKYLRRKNILHCTNFWALSSEAGSQTINPNFVVRDYDGIQRYSLSLMNGNNSERFTIDSTSGVMTYAVDYDVDQNAMPSIVQMTVQCRDSLAKTGTALIVLTIRVSYICLTFLFISSLTIIIHWL